MVNSCNSWSMMGSCGHWGSNMSMRWRGVTNNRSTMSSVFIDCDHCSRSYSGVVSHNIGSVRHALLSLATLGGDHLLAVLDGGDVSVDGADCASNSSGHMGGDIVTLLDRNTVTHWLGYLQRSLVNLGSSDWANDSSMVRSSVMNNNTSFGISISLSLAQVMSGSSDHSLGWTLVTMDRSTLGDSDGLRGRNVGGDHLAVVTHHVSGVDALGGDLLAGGGDHLLAHLGDGGVNHLVILLVTHLPGTLHLPGRTLELGHRVTLRSRDCHWLVTRQQLGVSIRISSRVSLSLDSSSSQTSHAQQSNEFHS